MGRWRRAMQNPTLAWMVVATLVTGLLSVPVASAEVVAGFETGADLQRWSAQGKSRVERTAGPPGPGQGRRCPAGGQRRPDPDEGQQWPVHQGGRAAPRPDRVRRPAVLGAS